MATGGGNKEFGFLSTNSKIVFLISDPRKPYYNLLFVVALSLFIIITFYSYFIFIIITPSALFSGGGGGKVFTCFF